jgi:hypothetical protein
MISKDKTYRTRDGREVRIYATDGDYPFVVHGAIKNKDGQWEPEKWLNRGCATIMTQSDRDLIEVKPRIKRTVWLNVYDNEVISLFVVKEKADSMALEGRIACVKVEIDCEEGEGL